MLLRLTTDNPLNTTYVTSDTGRTMYTILTRSALTKPPYSYYRCLESDNEDEEKQPSITTKFSNSFGSVNGMEEELLWEKSWLFPLNKFVDGSPVPDYCQEVKHIWILNSQDNVLAELIYKRPNFTAVKLRGRKVLSGKPGPLDLFFGICSRVEKKQFRARLDIGDLEWVLMKEEMQLISDDEDQTILMRYHTGTRRTDQKKLCSPRMKGETFLEINEPGMEWVDKDEEAQILATFCMMEITRRTLFMFEFAEDATSKVGENTPAIRLQRVLRRMRSMHLL